MQTIAKDTAGLGILLWLIGYIASLLLFMSPLAGIMGWILIAVFTPVSVLIVWRWFTGRNLPLTYYAGLGIACWRARRPFCSNVVLRFCRYDRHFQNIKASNRIATTGTTGDI